MSEDQPRVEDELTELLESAALTRRQAGAVAARLGFDGAGAGTLQDAARDWGYSRERVRQLEARLRDRSAEDRPLLPAVREALDLIEVAAPDERSWVAGRIADAGHARRPFDPAGILAAAELIGAEPTARVSGRFVTPVHLADPIAAPCGPRKRSRRSMGSSASNCSRAARATTRLDSAGSCAMSSGCTGSTTARPLPHTRRSSSVALRARRARCFPSPAR